MDDFSQYNSVDPNCLSPEHCHPFVKKNLQLRAFIFHNMPLGNHLIRIKDVMAPRRHYVWYNYQGEHTETSNCAFSSNLAARPGSGGFVGTDVRS